MGHSTNKHNRIEPITNFGNLRTNWLESPRRFSHTQLMVFALLFAAVGGFLLYSTFAAPALGSSLPSRLPQSSGAGGIYYVDGSNGNDANNGSSSMPWKTINKALSTVPLKGSIIKIRPGVYSSSGTSYVIKFSRAGDVTDPVTLIAETPGTVRITNANQSAWTLGGWIINASGLRIKNLIFNITTNRGANTGADGIQIEKSDRIEIDTCTFYESGTMGVITKGGGSGENNSADDVWVINSSFRPSGSDVYAEAAGNSYTADQYFGSRGSHYIYAGQGGNSTYDFYSGSERLVVVNNTFIGTAAGGTIQLGPEARHSYIVNNTFFGNHAGDLLGWNTEARYAGSAIDLFWNKSNVYATSYTQVVNNLMVDNNGHAAHGSGSNQYGGNVVELNMSYDNDNGKGNQCDVNDDFEESWCTNVLYTEGRGNFEKIDPMFVNPLAYDYHLKADSPAAGKADPVYAYPSDKDGVARSSTAPSLGAYEYTTSTTPPPSETSSIQNGNTVPQGTTWTVTTEPNASLVEFWADGVQIGTDSTEPYTTVINLAPGIHNIDFCPTINTVRACHGAYAAISVTNFTPTAKPGDVNNDNTVNITDLSILLSNYGTSNTAVDINQDGTVNILDLSILLSNYGT